VYDPAWISGYYDEYGEREWDRLDPSAPAMDRVNFETHRALLREFVHEGDRVLEVGAGPGRFTIELAGLGARVVVADISPRQLELNREKVGAAGLEAQVEARHIVDVVDLSKFEDGGFDAAVCYGGPISYVLERAGDAVAELMRVTRPQGHVFLSVMSKLGSTQRYLRAVFDLVQQFGLEAVRHVLATGDLSAEINDGHRLHMFTWTELEALLAPQPGTIVAASAANYLSLREDDLPDDLSDDLWRVFLEWELDACRERGILDGGTHIIAVLRRH
jgi:ubiquinone/menaquinone biosynthesis C-methylase UbiE